MQIANTTIASGVTENPCLGAMSTADRMILSCSCLVPPLSMTAMAVQVPTRRESSSLSSIRIPHVLFDLSTHTELEPMLVTKVPLVMG